MLLDANDLAIVPHLCLDGYWEAWITAALARVLRSDFWCLDVGANHGYYTLLMADAVGPGGRVLAVEPNTELVQLVEFSLRINGLIGRASAVAYAASDIDSAKVNLVFPRQHAPYGTICRSPGEGDECIEVNTVTLDTLSRDWPRVDLVKIDAEGAEWKIWRGMQETLRRNPYVIVVMEVNRTRFSDVDEFLRDIQDAGFALRHIAFDGEVRALTEETLLTSENDWMLFLQKS
jgi:FkbM family methyltransferase